MRRRRTVTRGPGRAGAAAAALSLLAVVSLAGCGGSSDGTAEPATVSQPSSVGPTSSNRTCPQLDRAQPRDDGLPDLELPCLDDGPAVNLADLRGTPTVLNVWAAWCTNCDREMPLFADAMERAGSELRFFGVHYKATRDQGRASEDDFGVPFPSAHDGDGDLTVARLGTYAPPQTLFVAADGEVVGRKVGEITSQEELDGLVERYLGVRL